MPWRPDFAASRRKAIATQRESRRRGIELAIEEGRDPFSGAREASDLAGRVHRQRHGDVHVDVLEGGKPADKTDACAGFRIRDVGG